jgi:hypothetical protein
VRVAAWEAEEEEVLRLEAWVAEEVELLTLKVALVGEVAAEQEKKWEGEAVEVGDRLLQEVAARVLRRLMEVEVGLVRVEEEVAAFLQQQDSKLDKMNPSGAAEEDRQNEQAVEVALKIRACPRKEAAHRICLLKVAGTRYRPPKVSSAGEEGEVGQVQDQAQLSWLHGSLWVRTV